MELLNFVLFLKFYFINMIDGDEIEKHLVWYQPQNHFKEGKGKTNEVFSHLPNHTFTPPYQRDGATCSFS